ncbi:hypothetical protein HanXRQr2_Chr09g0395091 [Helianthus annuus]|uniref:Uncharacterized protein n=1 Tax=Helianthus annuus TaxID=4232 RepID=A0A251TWV4_HELAN|nr:hypothetical protein HanXRQr2_Chr09g0395091 [Helianthus annuus]KAJ0893715.1 hypothetical protein HanPSC8_Chr09g0380891 [Helianthus annuus]
MSIESKSRDDSPGDVMVQDVTVRCTRFHGRFINVENPNNKLWESEVIQVAHVYVSQRDKLLRCMGLVFM